MTVGRRMSAKYNRLRRPRPSTRPASCRMALAVVLKLQSHAATAVVVRARSRSGSRSKAWSACRCEGVADPRAVGQQIAAALEPLGLGRAATIVAVPRSELNWQNYDLPPAPAAELPDLVHLQAQRDLPLADDGVGLRLPLASRRRRAPAPRPGRRRLTPAQLDRIRQICYGRRPEAGARSCPSRSAGSS